MAIPVTTTGRPSRRGVRPLTAVLVLVAALALAAVVNAGVAAVALAAGADPRLGALSPSVFVPFTVIGMLVAYAGWRLVRRLVPRPRRVLRVLVPVLLVLSWIPDLSVGLSGTMAGVSTTGIVGLMTMHLVAVLVAVPTFQRIAPVGATASA